MRSLLALWRIESFTNYTKRMLIKETLEQDVLDMIAKMDDETQYKLHRKGDPVVGSIKFPMKGRLWKKLIEKEVPEKDDKVANITMEQMKKMGLPGLTRGSNKTAPKKKRN